MIWSSFSDVQRILVQSLPDLTYSDQKWAARVQDIVGKIALENERVAIIGHKKDESSYYLKMFPQWELVEHEMNENVSATNIRDLYFEGHSLNFLRSVVPQGVFKFLQEDKNERHYGALKEEYEFVKGYKERWDAAPFPPTIVTTDAVVVQSGHILLVERGGHPGKGLWALPGGFIKQSERLVDGMIRELREETRLKVPGPVLKGSIVAEKVFDAPNRSLRGRTITVAYLIELPPGELPSVKGSDDAAKAQWVPLSEVREEEMFEDHFHIIDYFVSRV